MRVPIPVTSRSRVPDQTQGYLSPRLDQSGVRALAGALGESAQLIRQEQDRREQFDLNSALIKESAELTSDFQTRKEEEPLGADGFTDRVNSDYGLRHEQLVQNFRDQGYNEDLVNGFSLRLADVRNGFSSRALQFQGESYRAKVDDEIRRNGLNLQQLAQSSPYDMEGLIAESDETIELLPHLTAEEKLERRTRAAAEIRNAAAIGLVQSDPDAVVAALAPSKKISTTIPGLKAGQSYANVPFAQVKEGIIGKEGPVALGGYNAIAYNTANGNAAGVPREDLTSKTLGEVYEFQRNVMRPRTRGRRGANDVGSTGVGAYQFESQTLAENARIAFGDNWKSVPFTPQNQDKIAETLWDRVKGNPALLQNTWALFNRGGGETQDVTVESEIPLPLPEDGKTGNPVLDALDVEQRARVLNVAQRTVADRERKAIAAITAEREGQINSLMIGLFDGTLGQEAIDKARNEGLLTDYEDIKRAQGIFDQKNKVDEDLNNFNLMMNTPNFSWNQYDKSQKDAVDAGVEAMGGSLQAAASVWEKTGLLAKSAQTALRGGLISTNPQVVRESANIAGNMVRRRPNAFAGVEGGTEIENAALAFNHYVYDLGQTPQEAANRIAQENSPEFKQRVRVGQPELDAVRTTLRKEGAGVSDNVFDGARFISPGTEARASAAYADLVVGNMQRGRDEETARAMAAQQLKRVFGVTKDGLVMQYAPEAMYPQIRGSHDYIYEDAAATVVAETGRAPVANTLRLIPIPGVTDQDFRSGQLPRYRVMYGHEVDGQVIFDTVPGQWRADTRAPLATQTVEDEQNYRAARARLPGPSLSQLRDIYPKRRGESGFEYQTRLNNVRLQLEERRQSRIQANQPVPRRETEVERQTREGAFAASIRPEAR